MSPRLRRLSWMPLALFVGAALMASGCSGESGDDDDNTVIGDDDASTTPSPTPTATPCVDADQDGSCLSEDCNDNDASIHPGAPDACDAGLVDSNCDGVDACTLDGDGDGYCGDAYACSDGAQPGDCNDNDTSVHPGAFEGSTCDGIDQDCSGVPDNGTSCYDDDGDGFSEAQGDCDDGDHGTYPGAPERFDGRDNDCNPATNEYVVTVTPERATVIYGEKKSEKVGWSLAGVSNLVSAGSASLILGVPGLGGNGGVAIYLASSTWSDSTPISASPVLIKESQAGAKSGWSVANVGDLNGDGLNDFAVGAPYYDRSPGVTDSGRAYAILGQADLYASAKDLDSASASVMPGYATNIYLGFSVAGGNLNGDDFDDLIVGAPQTSNSGNYGWVFTLPGQPTLPSSAISGTITELQGSGDQGIGEACAYAGDTDNNGYGDFLCGGNSTSNKEGFAVWLPGSDQYKNPNLIPLGIDDFKGVQLQGKVNAEVAGGSKDLNNPGNSISGSGDVNNDGYPDFIVADGGPTKSYSDPVAFLFLGGSTFLGGSVPENGGSYKLADAGPITILPGSNDSCPCSVSLVGDMNQDGYNDILVGTSASNNGSVTGAGRVYLILGRDTLPSTLTLESDANYILESGTQGEQFGMAVAWAGDLNQDGYDDFAIGAPGAAVDSSTTNSGRVYLMFGFNAPTP